MLSPCPTRRRLSHVFSKRRRCSYAALITLCLYTLGCGGGATKGTTPSPSPSPSPTPSGVYDPCNGAGDYSWQGNFVSQQITLPATPLSAADATILTGAYDPTTLPSAGFDAAILAPSSQTQYPGLRPAVVLAHGHNGNLCNLWWLAHALAGNGYIVVVYTNPYNVSPNTLGVEIDGMVNAIQYLASSQNPYLSFTNSSDIAVGGWSEGSSTTMLTQGFPDVPQVKAAILLDNLKEYATGDPGAAQDCTPPQQLPDNPVVPAIAFASDAPCAKLPNVTTPDIKENGWSWWSSHNLPVVEFVMAGYVHTSFSSAGAPGETPAEISLHFQTLAAIIEPWLNAYLNNQPASLQQTLACTFVNQTTSSLLSTQFLSGVNLPSTSTTQSSIHTSDYHTYLQTSCP